MLAKLLKLIKLVKIYQSDIILALAIVLISIISFNLGKISAYQQKKTPITITKPDNGKQLTNSSGGKTQSLQQETKNYKLKITSVVTSKNSISKVYHFPWCPSASKIADKNKIIFATEAAAISAGYTLAGNCTK